MKLIVQIPCLNEEKTLPITIRDIPREIDGVDEVEILVIDDGSTDRTVGVAKELGVDHVIRNTNNKGLARSFMVGLDASIRLGADIIVNTDGDNQYRGEDIPKLIAPILRGEADIVIGDRQTEDIDHFSFTKKRLQKIGSWVVRHLSETRVKDVTSGFRAYSREAALQMNIVSDYSYTLETIIQAGKKHLAVANVPVRTNHKLRESRLFKSIPLYIRKSVITIIRMYAMFQPLRVFFLIGGMLCLAGLGLGLRFLYFYFFTQSASGHIQSVILSGVLLIIGFLVLMIGLVADVISFNRRLIEDVLLRVKKMERSQSK
ncbi:glycosyltransferase family 2 protein [bacterium]|nr:glycosyltransferase family 2 protein [bacterium]